MGLTIFMSYASKDSTYYRIPYLAERLKSYLEIDEVLYWKDSARRSIIKYMNDSIKKCQVKLLFCSPVALESKPVELEWQAALKLEKIIIPIFFDETNIPALLTSNIGIQFDPYYFEEKIGNLYGLILKEANITKLDQKEKEVIKGNLEAISEKLSLLTNIILNIDSVEGVIINDKASGMHFISKFKEDFNFDEIIFSGFITALLHVSNEELGKEFRFGSTKNIMVNFDRGNFLTFTASTVIITTFFNEKVESSQILTEHLKTLKLICSSIPKIELSYE